MWQQATKRLTGVGPGRISAIRPAAEGLAFGCGWLLFDFVGLWKGCAGGGIRARFVFCVWGLLPFALFLEVVALAAARSRMA